jgi:plastocyanin
MASVTGPRPETVTVDLIARGMAFDKSTISVPAGALVILNFDNQDAGIPHNFSVYIDREAKEAIFVGDAGQGPVRMAYTFTAPSQEGTYFFRCDIHPVMNGDFIVK